MEVINLTASECRMKLKDNGSSDAEDEEDSDSKEWKTASMCLRDHKRTACRLQTLLTKKENEIHDLEEALEEKNKIFNICRKENKKLTQLLNAKICHYNKEKECYFEEINKLKREIVNLTTAAPVAGRAPYPLRSGVMPHSPSSTTHQQLTEEVQALKLENAKLRLIVEEIDEKNQEICRRFLQMKEKKNQLWIKCQEIEEDFMLSLQIVMKRFNDLRNEVNLFAAYVCPVNVEEQVVQISRSNHELALENSYLRLELQCHRKADLVALYGPKSSRRKLSQLKSTKKASRGSEPRTLLRRSSSF